MRHALASCLFTATAILTASVLFPAEAAAAKKHSSKPNLTGTVTVDGTPASNIVISDGFTVTTTDAKGRYSIVADADSSKFVFVSVPSHCAIPKSGMRPVIYQTIAYDGKSNATHDFALESCTPADTFSIFAVADVQLQNKLDLGQLQTDVIDALKYDVRQLTARRPVIGVSLGDLVWDNMPMYPDYLKQMDRIGIPFFNVIGNHDHDLRVKADDLNADNSFEEACGPTYYSFNIGKCHFIALDDILYTDRKHYAHTITQRQLQWLRQDLAAADPDATIVLCVHVPTSRRNSPMRLTNVDELYDILRGRRVEILSGHTHTQQNTTITDSIHEHTLGALQGSFWTGDLCADGAPRGYAVLTFHGPNLADYYYKGTDHPRNYQMYLYAPGESVNPAYHDAVIANIFNWHTDWKVEAREDNGPWTTVESNVVDYDPRAYLHLKGKHAPATRSWCEPLDINDHMLIYRPKNTDWTTVTFRATDPYGNVYTDYITNPLLK